MSAREGNSSARPRIIGPIRSVALPPWTQTDPALAHSRGDAQHIVSATSHPLQYLVYPLEVGSVAFAPHKLFDMTFPYIVAIPLLKDVRSQAPQAICELKSQSVSRTLILNREKPPFDNPNLRRALALTLDRKAFIDILTEGSDVTSQSNGLSERPSCPRCPSTCRLPRPTASTATRSGRNLHRPGPLPRRVHPVRRVPSTEPARP